MTSYENIVTIHKRDIHSANKAFSEFMKLSEAEFNSRSRKTPNLYKGISPAQLEEVTRDLLKDVAPQTPFRPEDITLVSGHSFPDITATDFYGIEVKSTKEDKWTSIGSSIVESTRNSTVENIYMLFGKLGGRPPEFRLRPYQDCLSDIAVTHSPRYLINMDMPSKDNIFVKMNKPYENFRQLEEQDKISEVRKYYIQKAKAEGKKEMPWWMGETANINLSFYNDLPITAKNEMMVRCYIIFYSMYDSDPQARYKSIALWLCNHYSLLCPNMRDFFTAGGICSVKINGKVTQCPHIVGELLDKIPYIKKLLDNPDEDLIKDIRYFWDFQYNPSNLFESWIKMVESHFLKNKKLNKIPIRRLIYEALNG